MSSRLYQKFASSASQHVPQRLADLTIDLLGYYLRGQVVTYRELANSSDVEEWKFGTAESIEFREPEYANPLRDETKRIIGSHTAPQPYVLEVPDVELVRPQGFKITTDDQYIVFNFGRRDCNQATNEVATDCLYTLKDGFWPFPSWTSREDVLEIETAVPLIHRWARNYSHWTEEWLPQLEGVQIYAEKSGTDPTLIIPSDPPAYITKSLEYLGYSEKDYIRWTHDRARIQKLVLPSVRRIDSHTSEDYIRDISGLRWVRKNILQNVRGSDTEDSIGRIFISREDAARRRIVNRDEVESVLSSMGFRTVILSELDFGEQKRLVRGAEAIVGTHGAGLTELIYADDALILELHGSYYTSVYYEMAQGLGLTYGSLQCEDVGKDIRVDVDSLREAVNLLLDE
jgi:hypothetical protein